MSARTNAIGVGDKAPHFLLPTANGGMWSLGGHLALGEYGPLVAVFYRGTWCTYCNPYLRGLLEVRSQLSDANATLIAVSPEAAPASGDDASADGNGSSAQRRIELLLDGGAECIQVRM